MDYLKKVQTGDKLRMPARTYNAFVDAAKAHILNSQNVTAWVAARLIRDSGDSHWKDAAHSLGLYTHHVAAALDVQWAVGVSGWDSSLKNTNCEYYLGFEGDPDFSHLSGFDILGKGGMATPVKIDYTTVSTSEYEFRSGLYQDKLFIPFNYSAFNGTDFTVKLDTSGWSAYIPPDVLGGFTGWIEVDHQYYVGDCVTHEGNFYVCLQDHVSSTTREPGTSGGVPYWRNTPLNGWDGGSDGDYTGYYWGTCPFNGVYIKPYYSSW